MTESQKQRLDYLENLKREMDYHEFEEWRQLKLLEA